MQIDYVKISCKEDVHICRINFEKIIELAVGKCMENDCFLRTLKFEMYYLPAPSVLTPKEVFIEISHELKWTLILIMDILGNAILLLYNISLSLHLWYPTKYS
jgi:hypothetical protein